MFGVVPPIRAPAAVRNYDIPEQGAAKFLCAGEEFQIFHIPGHSPGSVAFYHPGWGVLISGDTLFCGGVGRWDLPGGSRAALLHGLRKHLVPLPPETRVYAGHGPQHDDRPRVRDESVFVFDLAEVSHGGLKRHGGGRV